MVIVAILLYRLSAWVVLVVGGGGSFLNVARGEAVWDWPDTAGIENPYMRAD